MKKMEYRIATGLRAPHVNSRVNEVIRIGEGKVIFLEGDELKEHIRGMARQMHKPVQEVGRRLKRNRWVTLAKKENNIR